MASADPILEIVGPFTPAPPAWSAAEAAQALKISRASAYRYLGQLKEAGFVEHFPSAIAPPCITLKL